MNTLKKQDKEEAVNIIGKVLAVQTVSAAGDGVNCLSHKPGSVGYRVTSVCPKKTVRVVFYFAFGWLTDEEWADLRQKEPRLAP